MKDLKFEDYSTGNGQILLYVNRDNRKIVAFIIEIC